MHCADKKVVEAASYKSKRGGHKTEFKIWSRVHKKVIYKLKLPGRCDYLYPYENKSKKISMMLIA